MPKIPRDLSGRDLVKLLNRFGYCVERQTGSHIRLAAQHNAAKYSITIPDHQPIKIGTLNSILNELSLQLMLTKEELVFKLFS